MKVRERERATYSIYKMKVCFLIEEVIRTFTIAAIDGIHKSSDSMLLYRKRILSVK